MYIVYVGIRRKHLTCVKTEDGEFMIDTAVAQSYGLKAGMTLDCEQWEQILHDSEFERIKSKALWRLSVRDYAAKELAAKLYREFDREITDEVICLLLDSGALDDERFAQNLAYEMSEIRHASRRNIRLELLKRGVSKDIADEVCEELPEDEIPAIIEQIELRYSDCFDDEKNKRRMINGLLRKGYSYDDIKKAIIEYDEMRGN